MNSATAQIAASPTIGKGLPDSGSPILVSIIIVSWNARDYLVGCLESIRKTAAGLACEVIVVDNGSRDGSPEAVVERFPEVKLIQTGSNLGFSRANNIGIDASRGRYLCFINSDVVVGENCLQTLIGEMDRHPNVGMGAPRLLNRDLTKQANCRRFPTLAKCLARALFINSKLGDPIYLGESSGPVEVLAGSFWIVRREALNQVGKLDENFFFYGEDLDWCFRFKREGLDRYFFPRASAIHFGGASSSVDPYRFSMELQRAWLRLWRKYHNPASCFLFGFTGLIYYGLRALGYSAAVMVSLGLRKSWRERCSTNWSALKNFLSLWFEPAGPVPDAKAPCCK